MWTCLLLLLAASPARAADGFLGHYGYLLTLPEGYSAAPSFKEEAEVVLIIPASCDGKKPVECAALGLLEVTALPKPMVKRSGITTLRQYADAVVDSLRKAKLAPKVTRGKSAGFPSTTILMRGHPEPLNAMIMVEGSKVFYRVKFNEKAARKTAERLLSSLKELKPTDEPPPAAKP